MPDVKLILGDCLDVLPTLAAGSVDAVITDPPYPEIDRDYGRMTESEWWDMMMGVCRETRRILKPTGSAVFILQPNSSKVGSMRGWMFEFQAWVCREWNMVQDVWWWNYAMLPQGGATHGLMRGSVKACVWCGPPDCHHDQTNVLWSESESNAQKRLAGRANPGKHSELEYLPSGAHIRRLRVAEAAERRGGVTPFNLLPIANSNSTNSAGSSGHGAGTPLGLSKWWTRYICPPAGIVLDPFIGSGTMGIAAVGYGNSIVGIERDEGYFKIAQRRIADAQAQMTLPLFDTVPGA